jgi:hypothetical protein
MPRGVLLLMQFIAARQSGYPLENMLHSSARNYAAADAAQTNALQ